MAESKEDQTKPLSPFSLTIRSDQPNEDPTKHVHHSPRTKLILCCGLVASLSLLIAVTLIVLSLTVFHLRHPNLTVDSISFIRTFDLVNGKVNKTKNATVSAEISLRNPNAALFRVKNVTVLFYYGELVVVGISSSRREIIPVKRTVKMNLTADIVTTKLLASVPDLTEDLNGKGVDLRSSVEVLGEVKIMKGLKKSVHLKTDCSMKIMNNSSKPAFQCFHQT